MTLTAERLREVMNYDPDTGFLTWKIRQGVIPAGVRAGSINRCGNNPHRYIQIDREGYLSGRLAWLHVHGVWPKRIFRDNGDTLDDRIENLRASAPVYRGARIPGIYQICNKFQVGLNRNGRYIYVGTFDSLDKAKEALRKARVEHKAPSKFANAKWIYKVTLGWSVRVKLRRKAKLIHLGTFPTYELAQAALARARAPKPVKAKRKAWWEDPAQDPGAMMP